LLHLIFHIVSAMTSNTGEALVCDCSLIDLFFVLLFVR
jgi:hypothetical protein